MLAPQVQAPPGFPQGQVAAPDRSEPVEMKDPTGGQEPILPEARRENDSGLLVRRILSHFETYKQRRSSEQEPIWEKAQALYLGEATEPSFPYASSYPVMEIFRQVECQKALAFQALLVDARFEYRARQLGGEEAAYAAQQIVQHQLVNLGLETHIQRWLGEVAKFGTSYLAFGWGRYKPLKFKQTRVQTDEAREKDPTAKAEEIAHGGPCLEWLSPWKVYCHPDIEDICESPFVFVRDLVGPEYLQTEVNEGRFDRDAVKKAIKAARGPSGDFPEMRNRRGFNANDEDAYGDRLHELLTCYTTAGWVYSVVDSEHLVQAQRNPYETIPILDLKNYPVPGYHYGIGEPTILDPEQALLRDIYSMWVDTIHFDLNPTYVVRDEDRNNFEAFSFRPGAVLYTSGDPQSAVNPIRPSGKTFAIEHSAQHVRQNMQWLTGMTDEVTGLGSRHRTATGLARLQNAAQARVMLKLLHWAPQFRRLYAILHALNAAFLDEDVALKVEGVDGRDAYARYGSAQFSPEVDVDVILPLNMEPPEVRRQNLMALYTAVRGDPGWDTTDIKLDIGRAFGFRHPRRLVVSPSTASRDVFWENEDYLRRGFIADPRPSEDHALHLKGHGYVPSLPQFQTLPPVAQQAFAAHMEIHERYMEQTQNAASAQAAQQVGMRNQDEAQAIRGEATAAAGMGPGWAGAAQQGVPPQVGPMPGGMGMGDVGVPGMEGAT